MEGITEVTPLQPALEETGKLPHDLGEAIALAEKSEFLRETLPAGMLEKYLTEKRRVWNRFQIDPRSVFHQHLRTI